MRRVIAVISLVFGIPIFLTGALITGGLLITGIIGAPDITLAIIIVSIILLTGAFLISLGCKNISKNRKIVSVNKHGERYGTGELSPVGTTALILSSVLWALGSLYSTKSKLPVSILASSGMIMITGGLILIAISLSLGEYRGLELSDISLQSSIALVYLILIVTVVGFTDFYWLLRVTTPSLANTFAYVSPVIAVILGWIN